MARNKNKQAQVKGNGSSVHSSGGQSGTRKKESGKKSSQKKVEVRVPSSIKKEVAEVKSALMSVKKPAMTKRMQMRDYKVGMSVMLPATTCARFTPGWSTEPTICGRPYNIVSVDVTTTQPERGGVGPILTGGSYVVAISRDPLTAIMEYVPVPEALWGYEWYFNTPKSGNINDTPIIGKVFSALPAVGTYAPLVYKKDLYKGQTDKSHPFGDISFARTARHAAELKLMYADAKTAVRFYFWTNNLATNALVDSGSIEVLRWNGEDAFPTTYLTYTTVSEISLTFGDSGYHAFVIKPNSGCYVTMNHDQGDGPPSVLSHRPIPGIMDRTTMTGLRVIGASAMVTPDAAELAKGGWAAGVQIGDAYTAESFLLNATGGHAVDAIANLRGSFSIGFEHGIYGWHKPLTRKALEMQRPIRYNIDYSVQSPDGTSGAASVSTYVSYMDPPDGWLLLAVNTPPNITGGATSFPGGLMHTTMCWSVEYTSNDLWLSPKVVLPGPDEFETLMRIIADAPQFTRNSFHFRDIISWLKKGVKTVASEINGFIGNFGPTIKKTVNTVLDVGEDVTGALMKL